jgi:putative transposase
MDSNGLALGLAIVQAIDDILRDGARRALQAVIEREVEEYIERNKGHVDDHGRRQVVRNGHHPARKILSGNGQIEVEQPRVNDKRVDADGNRIRFTSKILPRYLRKTKVIEELVYI